MTKKQTATKTTRRLHAHSKERIAEQRQRDQQRALVWAMFAAAEVSRSVEYARSIVDCAKVADGMLAEFEKRWGHVL